MNIVDGRHRLIAYKELNILVPVFIGRKQIRFGYCWRKGIAYNDGTINDLRSQVEDHLVSSEPQIFA